jgi:hypothetical protein
MTARGSSLKYKMGIQVAEHPEARNLKEEHLLEKVVGVAFLETNLYNIQRVLCLARPLTEKGTPLGGRESQDIR